MLKKYTFPLLSSCFLLLYSMSIYAKPQEKTLEKYVLTAKQHAEFCQQWVQFCTDGKADTLFQALYTTNFTEPLSYQDSAFLKLPKFP